MDARRLRSADPTKAPATKMITTQRAYSAAAKIITTADEMLEELIRIRR